MNANISTLWATSIIDELARCGLREVVIAPGSRSTPLALALEAHPEIRVHVVHDERGAGFEALGMAATSACPVAVVCTSGTAAANLYPAVCEAKASHVPLLILTADRPLHEQAAGTPQTMDQSHLFGSMVVDFVALPTPSFEDSCLRALRATICHVFWRSTAPSTGPVHVNVPFQKPLEPGPNAEGQNAIPESKPKCLDPGWLGRACGGPWTRHLSGPDALSRGADLVRSALETSHRPVIIAGPLPRTCVGLLEFAAAWNIPVFAEALSQMRGSEHPMVMEYADLFLGSANRAAAFQPDLILRFGGTSTATSMLRFLETSPARHMVVTPWIERCDPDHRAEAYFHIDPEHLFSAIGGPRRVCHREDWTVTIQNAGVQLSRALRKAMETTEFFEGVVVDVLSSTMPPGSTIVVSSSMPVRDVETFFHPRHRDVEILFNRGVNGIDGLVSTALGVAALRRGPVCLLVGDIALLHDLNALARLSSSPLFIVALNNNGGQIFASLPIRDHDPAFTRLFLTPHGISFSSVAKAMGVRAIETGDRMGVIDAIQSALGSEGPQLIEVRTEARLAQTRRESLLCSIVSQITTPGADLRKSDPSVLFSRRFQAGVETPLMLLHGFSKDHRSWNRVVDELRYSGSIHAVDLPGHGFSSTPPFQIAEELLEWFHRELDRLIDPAGSVNLAGYSMGGRLALSYAAARSGRVRRLALLSTSSGIQDPDERRTRAGQDLALAHTLRSTGLHAFLRHWESLPLLQPHRPVPPDALRAQSAIRYAQTVEGLAWALHHLSPGLLPCLTDALLALECPVLLVTGEKDARYLGMAQAVAATSKNISVEIISNAGHDLPLEAPEDVGRILTSWFSD